MGDVPEAMYRQSAVIAYRRGTDGLEVLLVTSRKGKRWVLPKGVVEPDMTPAASAANEAFEEAGVRGSVEEGRLGTYRYRKWGGTCTVEVFAMAVDEELPVWPEMAVRERAWLSPTEARRRIDGKKLKRLLDAFAEGTGRGSDQPSPGAR